MNIVGLIGRLTADPDIRVTQSQMKVANFTLAVDRRNKEKETDFIRCKAFDKTAGVIETWCHKGTPLGIQGRIQSGSYQDKDGKIVYTTDIIIDRVDLLEFKRKKEEEERPDFREINEEVPF